MIVKVQATLSVSMIRKSKTDHERFALVEAALVALTTSGDSMSCRKECRLRVVRGFGMVVSWQRSEF